MSDPTPPKKLPVTKLDAARRQLETAITLWFDDLDPVSIHTLASAANQILSDVNKAAGGKPLLFDTPNPSIKPQHQKEFRRLLREVANFFKHAESDSTGTLFFSPNRNKVSLIQGCQNYRELAQEKRPLMELFTFYLAVHEPQLFVWPLPREAPGVEYLRSLSKRAFFTEMLPVVSRIAT